jgi:hypothetical protein
MSNEFIPAATKEQMLQRTNWGHLLETHHDPAQASEQEKSSRRKVAW